MATDLACYAPNGCIVRFPIGDPGEVLGVSSVGELAWLTVGAASGGSESTTFGVTGGSGAGASAPSVPPSAPAAGDQHIETYDDAVIFWEYDGTQWVISGYIPLVTSFPYRMIFTIGGDAHVPVADETLTYRPTDDFTLTGISASLSSESSSDVLVEVTVDGTLAATVTIDAGEKTSLTAAVPAQIVLSGVTADSEIIATVTTPGDGMGLTVTLIGFTS